MSLITERKSWFALVATTAAMNPTTIAAGSVNSIERGDLLCIDCKQLNVVKVLIVDRVGTKLTLADPHAPYDRLRIMDDGTVEIYSLGSNALRGGCLFDVVHGLAGMCRLVSFVRTSSGTTKSDIAVNLAMDERGIWRSSIVQDYDQPSLCCDFYISLQKKGERIPLRGPEFSFSKWEARRFVLEGYLQLSGLVAIKAVQQCNAAINHELGKPGKVVAGGVQEGFGKLSGEMSNCHAVRSMFSGKLAAAADALLGCSAYEKANLSAQVALRFPEMAPEGAGQEELVWHTDGLRQGQSHGFSLLVGVCLSDACAPDQGNLAVWPGSHLLLHQCKVPPHGALDLPLLRSLTQRMECFANFRSPAPPMAMAQSRGWEGKEAGEGGPGEGIHDNEPALPSLGAPLQLLLKAGDVVFLHPDLAHAGARNLHCEVRRMLYFRLRARTGKGQGQLEGARFSCVEALLREHERDMWCDLPGLTEVLGQEELRALTSLYRPVP